MAKHILSVLSVLCLLSWTGPVLAQQLRGGEEEDTTRSVERGLTSVGSTTWSYDFVKRGARATNLTHLVKNENLADMVDYYNTTVYQSFNLYDDRVNDRSVVAKDDDVCYLVFQGQNRNVLMDIWQTLNPFVKRDAFGTGCDVRRSFYSAYETRFADEMRAEVDRCVQSCTDGPCPFVLSGHSTGAATAMIASLDPRLKQYNPVIYAMGPLRGIVSEDCEAVDLDNIYRIVAANAGVYDAASDGSPKMGRHYGKFFMMDESDEFYYIGPNDNVLRSPDSYNIHIVEVYVNRMNALAARPESDFPITVSQFPLGHWCGFNDECESGLCSEDKFCKSGENTLVRRMEGAPCDDGSDCTSGTCKMGTCSMSNGLLGVGSPCEENADCATDKCLNGACLDQLYNGSWCADDFECLSQSCSGTLSWILMRRCADAPDDP